MSKFARAIRPHVNQELDLARDARARGDAALEFTHLENAHVLGQASTREHVRVHGAMLGWGVRNRRPAEVAGQLFRILGAATKTWVGLVPAGNTGGTNVSPFKPLPIDAPLQRAIDSARSGRS